MLPWVYEFRWDLPHLVFLGAFYLAGLSLAVVVLVAWLRSRRDVADGAEDRIRWQEEFQELPRSARACRHALTGRAPGRLCANGFDCRHCIEHRHLASRTAALPPDNGLEAFSSRAPGEVAGSPLSFPEDRAYHRGHTWVKALPEGTVEIGLDDLATRLVGRIESMEMPATGEKVHVNGTAWRMRAGGCDLRVLSPVDGEVIATGGQETGWYLRIRPDHSTGQDRHLLRGPEVRAWILRQMERLQALATISPGAPSLADGGVPVADLGAALPDDRKEAILAEILLEP